ncbi:hypothetical protein [Delftia sp. PS-11]|uniref:hypothetical protein n=1 Tax=Delftia sp. PS-11 TaxID=2767222 RepID=UPI0024569D94|nr:hypothetical protein [Delftia sp. PS-11]KAJ8742632.1 hypothetical protein H9T68_19320 [Delftia sp. PS-11]
MAPSSQELEPPQNPGRFKLAEQSHSEDMLNLMIARGYIVKLVDNAQVLRYMQTHFVEVLEEFAKIVEMTTVETT